MWASNKTGLAKISLEIFLTRYATSQKIVISKQIDKRSSITILPPIKICSRNQFSHVVRLICSVNVMWQKKLVWRYLFRNQLLDCNFVFPLVLLLQNHWKCCKTLQWNFLNEENRYLSGKAQSVMVMRSHKTCIMPPFTYMNS